MSSGEKSFLAVFLNIYMCRTIYSNQHKMYTLYVLRNSYFFYLIKLENRYFLSYTIIHSN